MRLRTGGLRGVAPLGIESGMFGIERGEYELVRLVIRYRLLDLLVEELVLQRRGQLILLPCSIQEITVTLDLSITFENYSIRKLS